MNAQDIINFIHNAEKKTPVKVYYRAKTPVDFPNCHQFGDVVFGDWKDIERLPQQCGAAVGHEEHPRAH